MNNQDYIYIYNSYSKNQQNPESWIRKRARKLYWKDKPIYEEGGSNPFQEGEGTFHHDGVLEGSLAYHGDRLLLKNLTKMTMMNGEEGTDGERWTLDRRWDRRNPRERGRMCTYPFLLLLSLCLACGNLTGSGVLIGNRSRNFNRANPSKWCGSNLASNCRTCFCLHHLV